jgi:hypothetical protein
MCTFALVKPSTRRITSREGTARALRGSKLPSGASLSLLALLVQQYEHSSTSDAGNSQHALCW